MLDPIFDHFHLLPELTTDRIIAAVERHLAEYAAQLTEKEAYLHTVSAGMADSKRTGDEAAADLLMKTHVRLVMESAQIKRLAAQEEELKTLAACRLKSLKN